MSNAKRRRELESRLTTQQRNAIDLLVANEFIPRGEGRRTLESIAAEVGVADKTLWEWRTKKADFIELKNIVADDFLSDRRPEVYGQLMALILGSQPSVKAIDLYLKRFGLLTEKQVVETTDSTSQRSNEDIQRQLDDLEDLLNEDKA